MRDLILIPDIAVICIIALSIIGQRDVSDTYNETIKFRIIPYYISRSIFKILKYYFNYF